MRVLPAAPEIPLEAPPAESFDLQDVLVCPACGGADAAVQQVEDAEVAKCPQCQCEFSPRMESVSRKVIRRISEHRQRRMQRFMERLPFNPPVSVNHTDYTLFRKLVDRLSFERKPNEAWQDAFRQIRDRFVDERVRGFTHRETGEQIPPVPREEAEARWAAVEPRWREVLLKSIDDPDVQRRLRLGWGDGRWQFDPEEPVEV